MCVNVHTAKYSAKFLNADLRKKHVYSSKSIEFLYGQPDFFRSSFHVPSVYAVIKMAAVGGRVARSPTCTLLRGWVRTAHFNS